MPVVLRMCPRYWISLAKKWHLLSFIDKWAFHIFSKTCLMCYRCASAVLLKMIMSSRYAIARGKSFKTPVISSWKCAVACVSLKGTLVIHIFQMVKWRLFWVLKTPPMECGDILLVDPRLWSILHCWVVKRWPLLWQRLDKFLSDLVECGKLMTRHFPLSPLGTTMMGADQLDWLPHITFAARSLLISFLTYL